MSCAPASRRAPDAGHRDPAAGRPTAEPDDSCFSITRSDVPDPTDGQLLLRVVYLSLDPYMRGRMSAAESYADPVAVGDVMVGATVCEVVESRHHDYSPGDFVLSYSGWRPHTLSDGTGLRRLDPSAASLSVIAADRLPSVRRPPIAWGRRASRGGTCHIGVWLGCCSPRVLRTGTRCHCCL